MKTGRTLPKPRPETISISHSVFLDEEQRKSLQIKDNCIETMGFSMPTVVINNTETSEPSKEVFCRYRICNSDGEPITMTKKGYDICISHSNCRRLADEDGTVIFAYTSGMEYKGDIYRSVHQVSITSRDVLDRSIYCVHLFQTASK